MIGYEQSLKRVGAGTGSIDITDTIRNLYLLRYKGSDWYNVYSQACVLALDEQEARQLASELGYREYSKHFLNPEEFTCELIALHESRVVTYQVRP